MTFSIVARCPGTGQLGVAVATARPAVGNRVPHTKPQVGAVATQANTNPAHGVEGLVLLEMGFAPEVVLAKLQAGDPDWEQRQVHLVNCQGKTAAHTGSEAVPWAGHLAGDGYSVAGNMLAGPQVLTAMARAYETAPGPLSERLLAAIAAGDAAGGDKRGKQSAAIRVVSGDPFPLVDLRVDDHPHPVLELRRIYAVYRDAFLA